MWTAFVTSGKKEEEVLFSFFLFFFPPSLLSIKCSLRGASRLRLSLSLSEEAMRRREPSPCWHVWDALTPACLPVGSYLYVSRENKQYTADLAYSSIGCKQVGSNFALFFWWNHGGNMFCICLSFNGLFNICMFKFFQSIYFSLDYCFFFFLFLDILKHFYD